MKALLFATTVAIALAFFGPVFADDGAAIYSKNCAVCHNSINPKLGDKTAWATRISKGESALIESVTNGKGMMRPRAGNPSLSNDAIKEAVEYIMSKSQ